MLPVFFILIYLTTFIDGEYPRKEKDRVIWIPQGLVRGSIFRMGSRHVQIFRGIPYAEPPIKDLRFAKTLIRQGVHDYQANEYGAACLQFNDHYIHDKYSAGIANQSEDCLFLNVFSPYDPDDEGRLYPILVWIHGGSFMAGSGDAGIDMEVAVENIVFKNVSLITFNYRLGPLGFLKSGDRAEGNYGLWDQVTVLRWIQTSMKVLNGDPTNVTVMGEDAGAAAASILAVSPVTKNLIHRVITISGSGTAGWALHRYGAPNWSVSNLADYLRCEKTFSSETTQKLGLPHEPVDQPETCNLQTTALDCFNNGHELSTGELLDCMRNELNFSSFTFRRALAFELGNAKMVVDGELIPKSGKELILENARMPLMIGISRKEWGRRTPQDYGFHRFENISTKERKDSVRKIVENSYHGGSEKRLHNSTLKLISTLAFMRYFNAEDDYVPLNYVVSKLQKMESDIEFVAPAQKEIEAYLANALPVYAYSFDYIPVIRLFETVEKPYALFGDKALLVNRTSHSITGRPIQAFHGLEHAYIFTQGYQNDFQIPKFTETDRNMTELLTNVITNFVKHGRPTIGNEPFNWPAYANHSAVSISMTTTPSLKKGSLHWPDTLFWNKEADLLEIFSFQERHCPKETYDLSSEERLQLAAYRRAWWALWVLVALIGLAIWGCIIFFVVKRCRSPRAKPYDNIVINR